MGYQLSKTACEGAITTRGSCSKAILSQEVWEGLRFCILRSVQVNRGAEGLGTTVWVARNQKAGMGSRTIWEWGEGFLRKYDVKKEMCRKLIFLHIIARSSTHLLKMYYPGNSSEQEKKIINQNQSTSTARKCFKMAQYSSKMIKSTTKSSKWKMQPVFRN